MSPNPPQPGQMLADFSLPSTVGRPLRISDYRNRSNLVVIFTGQYPLSIQDWLQHLGDHAADFTADETQVLIVAPLTLDSIESQDRLTNLPFPVLADANGQVHRSLDVWGNAPAVVVTDRYGEIYSVDQGTPDPAEILASLNYIELLCPE